MRDRTSAEPVPAQPSEQRPGRGLECGGRRAAAVTRRRGTWPPVTSSRVSLKLRLLKTPRTLVLLPSISAAGGCWWLLVVAAGLQSGRGGLLSAGPGQRTADSGHRGRAPPAVPAHAAPGTCGHHSQAGDTWHVAPRDWRRGHTCLHHTGVSAASLPLSGPGAAYGAAPPPATARLATFK